MGAEVMMKMLYMKAKLGNVHHARKPLPIIRINTVSTIVGIIGEMIKSVVIAMVFAKVLMML